MIFIRCEAFLCKKINVVFFRIFLFSITYERLKEEDVVVKEIVSFVSVYECLCKFICVCIYTCKQIHIIFKP